MVVEKPIIVFDGVCVLCNGAVNFIIKRDPQARFLFTPMQSEAGQLLIRQHDAPDDDGETFLLIESDGVKVRTDAALAIAVKLTWPWPVFGVFRLLPSGFRDVFYRWLARHRYRLFGKRETCMVPGDDLKRRFYLSK